MEKLVPKLRFPEFKGNWEKKKIGEVCEVSSGGTPSRSKPNYWNGNIPWVSTTLIDFNIINRTDEYITDDGLKNSSAKIFPKGTLLMAMYGQGKTRGKTAILGIDASTNQACGAIIPNLKLLNPTFLFQDLCNRYDIIRDSSNQGGQENLSGTIIKSFSVTYPSLPEQQKIASFLTSVDERLTLLAQQKEKLELYKKGVMQQIFAQKLRFKDENGNNYPDWEEKKLENIATYRRGSFPQPYGLPKWYDDINGTPFVQVYDVDDNFRLKNKTKQKISDLAKPQSVFVQKGSIIITIQGSIGRIAITQYDSYVDRTLLIFQKFNCELDKVFFVYSLFLLFEYEKTIAVGGTIKTITKEKINDFEINLPCLEEQQKIASFLSAIDIQIEGVSKKIEQTKMFKKGLLQQMFV